MVDERFCTGCLRRTILGDLDSEAWCLRYRERPRMCAVGYRTPCPRERVVPLLPTKALWGGVAFTCSCGIYVPADKIDELIEAYRNGDEETIARFAEMRRV
jgi:hypothetical protein